MLRVDELMVFYENAIAINELSIEVNEGEIVGIIGSNSAGKTTLMNTISGLLLDTKLKEQRKGGERITIYGRLSFLARTLRIHGLTNGSKWELCFPVRGIPFLLRVMWRKI